MALTQRGSVTATSFTTATADWNSCSYPSGVSQGDLLIAVFCTATTHTISSLSGWTQIGTTQATGTDSSGTMAWRIAGAAESSWSFTSLFTAGQQGHCAIYAASAGFDPAAPIHKVNQTNLGTVTTATGPSVTPTLNNCTIMQIIGTDPGTGTYAGTPDTSPTGVELYDSKTSSGSYSYIAWQKYDQSSAAALSLDYTGLTSDGYWAFQIAVAPKYIDAAGTSYTETGTAVKFHTEMVVGSGSYTETGTAATLTYVPIPVAKITQIYLELPEAAQGGGNKTITASGGTFTVTGTAASLEAGYEVAAASTSYTLTGTAANLELGTKVSAATTAFDVTGTAATLKRTAKVVADTTAYDVTGTAAGLNKGRRIAADTTAYDVTGTAASLEMGYAVDGDTTAFTVSGTAATLKFASKVVAGSTSYTVTGTEATLTYSGSGPKTLTADSGSFTFSGTAASLEYGYKLGASTTSFTVTGTAASLELGTEVAAGTTSFTVSGTAATLKAAFKLTASSTSYTMTGTEATLTKRSDKFLSADSGSFTVSGTAATLKASHLPLAANTTSYSVSGTAANLERGTKVGAATTSYTISGTSATLKKTWKLSAGSGDFEWITFIDGGPHDPYIVDLLKGYRVSAETIAYTFSGTSATLRATFQIVAGSTSYVYIGTAAGMLYSAELLPREIITADSPLTIALNMDSRITPEELADSLLTPSLLINSEG